MSPASENADALTCFTSDLWKEPPTSDNMARVAYTGFKRMEFRRNERAKTWFRSHRIFRSEANWYFHTREGIDVGPFRSEFEAQVESSILKNVLKDVGTSTAALAAIREFVLDARTASCDLKAFTDYVEKEGRF